MNVVALLESMWGWRGYSEAGDVIRYFRINPDNFSGRRLYRIVGDHNLLVTNSCRECQRSASDHGKPDPAWVESNLTILKERGMDLLLVCGKIAKETFMKTSFAPYTRFDGNGMVAVEPVRHIFMDHPAARRWSNKTLDDARNRVEEMLRKNVITYGMKWIGGATRQRVRRLARQQARLDMQQYRKRTPRAAAN